MATDPQLADLRRQLAALGYDGGGLAAAAAPLVAALLGDLVRATDSYSALKAAAGAAGQAGQTAQYQVKPQRQSIDWQELVLLLHCGGGRWRGTLRARPCPFASHLTIYTCLQPCHRRRCCAVRWGA